MYKSFPLGLGVAPRCCRLPGRSTSQFSRYHSRFFFYCCGYSLRYDTYVVKIVVGARKQTVRLLPAGQYLFAPEEANSHHEQEQVKECNTEGDA